MNKFATGSCWAISLFSIFAFYQHDCFFTMFQQGLPCLPQVTNWKQKNTALCTAKPAIYDHPLVLQKVVLKYRWSYNTGYMYMYVTMKIHVSTFTVTFHVFSIYFSAMLAKSITLGKRTNPIDHNMDISSPYSPIRFVSASFRRPVQPQSPWQTFLSQISQ